MKLNKKCLNAYNKAVKAEITVKGIRKAISDYNYYNTFNGITNVYRQGYIVCNFDTLTVRYIKEIENENNENILEDNEAVIIDAKSYIGMAMNTAIKFRVYEMIAKEIEAKEIEAEKKEAEKKEAEKELNTRLEAEKNLNARIEAEKAEYKKIYSPFYTHTYLMTINEYKIKVGEYLVLCGVGFFHTFSPTTIQVAKTAGYKRIYRVMTVNENEGKITVEHIETKEKYYFYFGYFVEHYEVKTTNSKKYSYAYNKASNKEVKAMIAYNFYNYIVNVLNYDSENWEKLSKIIAIHLDNEAVEAIIYLDEHYNFWRIKKDKDLKTQYEYEAYKKHEIKQAVKESCLLNIDENYHYTQDEIKRITDNALKVLFDYRYNHLQYAIPIKTTINNTIENYARLALINKQLLVEMLQNKELIVDCDKLRKLQLQLENARKYCQNAKRKEILTFYCWAMYCLWYVVDEIENNTMLEQIEALQKALELELVA